MASNLGGCLILSDMHLLTPALSNPNMILMFKEGRVSISHVLSCSQKAFTHTHTDTNTVLNFDVYFNLLSMSYFNKDLSLLSFPISLSCL